MPADDEWKTCDHRWGPWADIVDANFGVKFGAVATCQKCRARTHDDWTATRVGGVQRVLPPDESPSPSPPEAP